MFLFNEFPQRVGTSLTCLLESTQVSIQLVSPASGDCFIHSFGYDASGVSIQLVSPTSGDSDDATHEVRYDAFPFN